MQYYLILTCTLLLAITTTVTEKIADIENSFEHNEFLNYGDKKINKLNKKKLENSIFKSKVEVLSEVFKKKIDRLKLWGKIDIVFLVDASSSVGEINFKSELQFVKKIISDITIDYNHTRVALVTFSSPTLIVRNIDEISSPGKEDNKCFLLNKQLNSIDYNGGQTYTLGAFEAARDIFEKSRNESKKVLFLITDGFSNGGDPVPLANYLKDNDVTIYTIGISNGNYKELYKLSTFPGEYYSYLLDSFNEFESLARKALHVDLKSGEYIPLENSSPCDELCEEGNCCDKNAICTCGTTTGHYSCICAPGFYGSGLKNNCFVCVPGTYSNGPNLCLPCPDIQHTTVPPAISIKNCTCKSGYQATEDNKCEIIKCPKITTPKHGYLIKKRECDNVLHSACGIRCEVGYTLVGSSVRLCQKNGTWSGYKPSCEVKTCSALQRPPLGKVKCYQSDVEVKYDSEEDLPVDTTCSFECEKGRTLIGSKERICLPLGRWDGIKSSCKQIKCNKLPLIENGQIEPKTCTSGKQKFGTKCNITCNEGFKTVGPSVKQCTGAHGTWDTKFEDTTCKDIQPPKLICPKNVVSKSHLGKNFGTATWLYPQITDNSKADVSIWMRPSIKNISKYKFPIGETTVTYFAQDAFHNNAKCSFKVIIEDTELPIIEDCISPPTFLISESDGANITWDEPNIYDNSQDVKVNKSHEFGFFKIGTTTVTYIATDGSGNKNICNLNITLQRAECQAIPNPINGLSKCKSENDSMECVITCEEGYAIPLDPLISTSKDDLSSTNVICNSSDPNSANDIEGSVFEECTVTKIPKVIEHDFGLNIEADEKICNDTENVKKLTSEIEKSIQDVCVENCTVGAETDCVTNPKNITKRDVTYEEVLHKNNNKRGKVNVKFQIRGRYTNDPQESLNKLLEKNGTYNMSIIYDKSVIVCVDGFVPRKKRCVQCPKGSFHNTTTNKCQSCSIGFYNSKLGQTECMQCPENYSTRKIRSKSEKECREQCPPGTHARKRVIKNTKHHMAGTIVRASLKPHCKSCPIGTYQENYGQLACLPCPKGYTTTGFRTDKLSDCVPTALQICLMNPNICNHGVCVPYNDFHFTCNCHENYIGSYCDKRISLCDSLPCINGGTCMSEFQNNTEYIKCICPTGFSGNLCQEEQVECSRKCLNQGICVQTEDDEDICLCPDGFQGDNCELIIKHCIDDICENNSTCIEKKDTFQCQCTNGYIGRRCNILPCDYRPCKMNQICVNLVEENTTRHSYKCECSEGYYGEQCDQKINYCSNNPCLNNGICVSEENRYSCKCPALYYGTNCEKKKDTKYILNFPTYDTINYIRLQPFERDLDEITICLYLQTVDNFNYGTIVSYATNTNDNSFTLTDYTGLVLYVNNNFVVTDVVLNDGYWHHLCGQWSSEDGYYAVYVDGKMIKNGTGLSNNTKITGRGNMIIGQEQDIMGGSFSQAESFMGKMAYIDIWSEKISEEDILNHMMDCKDSYFGNLYNWPDLQYHIYGNIKVENSTFCMKCPEPTTLYNGYIDVNNNVAYYSCYKGYNLSNGQYAKGRKCTKSSKWEGVHEPFCKKVYCGYPGYVRNAHSIGNKYYFGDTVSFLCNDGYTLTGSNTIVCQESGSWYPQKPLCLGPQCTAFKKPEFSNLVVLAEHSYEDYVENKTTFDVGTQIEISCIEDTLISGENILTCQDNGTWDFEPPDCISSSSHENISKEKKSDLECSIERVPQPPLNGYIEMESLHAAGNGTSNFVEYKCRNGYKLHGDNITTCIIDGYWTEPNISCDSIQCVKPPKFKNMVLKIEGIDNNFYFGNLAIYDCVDGYRIFGSNKIRCLTSGRWTKMQGRCLKKSCNKPKTSDITVVDGNSYLFEEEVTVHCSSGNKYIWKCNKFGIWEGEKDLSC